jgi:putative drug exporter of the RND superfamily
MYASVARFCARYRWQVLAAWVLLFMVGTVIGGGVFTRLKDSNASSGSESAQGSAILNRAASMGPTAVVLVKGPPVNAAATRAAVQALTTRLAHVPQVTGAVNTYTSPDPMLRATDGHASLIVVSLRNSGDIMGQAMIVDTMRAEARGSVPGAEVLVGGDAAVMRESMIAVQRDLFGGTLIALPVVLIALFFIFRSWRPALLPIFAALGTIAGALLLLLGMTQVTTVATYATDVIILFGLALAVDYSLLMVNRFREARAAGQDLTAAVGHTAATAGRTVTFSALTVAASLAGLFAFANPVFTTVALSGIATVLIALATALTLVPALLGIWGRKIKPAARQVADDGFFGKLARRVQARPVLAAAGVTALLVAAAIPFLHAAYGLGDPRTLPQGSQSRQVALDLAAGFPGMRADPIQIVARIPASDPRIPAYAATLARQSGVAAVSLEHGLRGSVAAIDVTRPAPPRARSPSTWSASCGRTGPPSAPGSPGPRPG